jgi:hypothetical protein
MSLTMGVNVFQEGFVIGNNEVRVMVLAATVVGTVTIGQAINQVGSLGQRAVGYAGEA